MLHLYQTSTRRLILSCPPWPPCSYIARNICAFSIWLLFWKYPSLLTFSNCSCFSPSSPFSNCDSLTHPEPPLPTHTYNPPSQETHFCPLQNLSWPPYPSQFLWKQLHSYFTNIPSFLDCQTHIFWSGHLNVRYLAWLIFFNDFLKPSPSFSWSFGWSLTLDPPPISAPLSVAHLKWLCYAMHCSLWSHPKRLCYQHYQLYFSTSAPFPLLNHPRDTTQAVLLCPAVMLAAEALAHCFPDPLSSW